MSIKEKRKKKIRFNEEFLTKFCFENNIIYDKIPDDTKINRDTIITGNCNTLDCTKKYSKSFREIVNIGGPYCYECAKERGKEKKKLTNMKNFGVEHAFQSKEVRQKGIETLKRTLGVEHPAQSKEVQDKMRQTCLDRFGVENPMQSDIIKEKSKQTCLEKYGVEYYLQSEEVQEKSKQTCLYRYGVTSVMHVPEIADKCSKSAFTKKEYTLPSGNILQIQGYEHFALDELINLYHEDDIINGMLNVPEIWYCDENNKKHRHYVDFFIPSKQLCIEVKSTWTAEKKQDNIFLKQTAGKTLGYQYEIWIYDSKGNKVECHD